MTDDNSQHSRYLNKPNMKPRFGGGRPFTKSPGLKMEQHEKTTQRPMQRKPFRAKPKQNSKPNFMSRPKPEGVFRDQ